MHFGSFWHAWKAWTTDMRKTGRFHRLGALCLPWPLIRHCTLLPTLFLGCQDMRTPQDDFIGCPRMNGNPFESCRCSRSLFCSGVILQSPHIAFPEIRVLWKNESSDSPRTRGSCDTLMQHRRSLFFGAPCWDVSLECSRGWRPMAITWSLKLRQCSDRRFCVILKVSRQRSN